MRRGVIGADALETINAAATAIASAETRGPHDSIQKKRWGSCWNLYLCFGSNKNKRIGHAVLTPEPTTTAGSDSARSDRPSQLQPLSITLPFAAPPSSPASFLPSELPSAAQSPTGQVSMSSVSANMYSPGGPASIFSIGPYTYETQLVSPPIFSTFTTEPSTAPYTPPPESSSHLTTPSSPEVPFARLLEPNSPSDAQQRYPLTQYEFQSYQLQPGSPVSHLISPSSGISGSGTSSPFLDRDFAANYPFFLEFRTGNTPKLLDLDKIVRRDWGSCQGSGAVTPDTVGPRSCDCQLFNRQDSDVAPFPVIGNNVGTVVDHRVSFEITSEVIRCVGPKSALESVENAERMVEENTLKTGEGVDGPAEETTKTTTSEKILAEQQREKTRTITLGSTKEFNFDNLDGGNHDEPSLSSSNQWSFFPIMQTGVS